MHEPPHSGFFKTERNKTETRFQTLRREEMKLTITQSRQTLQIEALELPQLSHRQAVQKPEPIV